MHKISLSTTNEPRHWRTQIEAIANELVPMLREQEEAHYNDVIKRLQPENESDVDGWKQEQRQDFIKQIKLDGNTSWLEILNPTWRQRRDYGPYGQVGVIQTNSFRFHSQLSEWFSMARIATEVFSGELDNSYMRLYDNKYAREYATWTDGEGAILQKHWNPWTPNLNAADKRQTPPSIDHVNYSNHVLRLSAKGQKSPPRSGQNGGIVYGRVAHWENKFELPQLSVNGLYIDTNEEKWFYIMGVLMYAGGDERTVVTRTVTRKKPTGPGGGLAVPPSLHTRTKTN